MNRDLTNEIINHSNMGVSANIFRVLPNPDKILRNTGRKYATLRDLKSDPHIWSCIQSRKSGLLAIEWSLIPNGANETIVNIINKFLKRIDLHNLIRNILEAPLFGFQPFEIIWEFDKQFSKVMLPKEINPKPQEWFVFDAFGKIKLNNFSEDYTIPDYKMLIATYESDTINPYGHSLLSKCFYPVTFKNGGLKLWLNFIEKFGSPLVLGQYQRGTTQDEIETFAESLTEMANNAVIVSPSDINLEFKEAAKTSSSELFRDLVKFCNSEISKAILSQTLTTEVDMGSYAATEIHYKVRKEVILSDARLVESFINKLIKWIIELNFKSFEVPEFNLIINDAENTQRIERDLKIIQMGYKFSNEYIQNVYGFKNGELLEEVDSNYAKK